MVIRLTIASIDREDFTVDIVGSRFNVAPRILGFIRVSEKCVIVIFDNDVVYGSGSIRFFRNLPTLVCKGTIIWVSSCTLSYCN